MKMTMFMLESQIAPYSTKINLTSFTDFWRQGLGDGFVSLALRLQPMWNCNNSAGRAKDMTVVVVAC